MSTTLHTPDASVRSARRSPIDFTHWSPRTSALVGGTTLAAMAVLAIFGNFIAITPLVTPGDAAKTAADIGASPVLFGAGILAMFLATLLDLVVAAALYRLFRPVNRRLSAVAAWTRVAFAAAQAVAIAQLVPVFGLLDQPAEALSAVEAFRTIWLISLGLFGMFLLLMAYLEFRSGFIPKVFGILLAIAGIGYVLDALGTVFIPGFGAIFGNFGFVGEVASMLWLLIGGRRLSRN